MSRDNRKQIKDHKVMDHRIKVDRWERKSEIRAEPGLEE